MRFRKASRPRTSVRHILRTMRFSAEPANWIENVKWILSSPISRNYRFESEYSSQDLEARFSSKLGRRAQTYGMRVMRTSELGSVRDFEKRGPESIQEHGLWGYYLDGSFELCVEQSIEALGVVPHLYGQLTELETEGSMIEVRLRNVYAPLFLVAFLFGVFSVITFVVGIAQLGVGNMRGWSPAGVGLLLISFSLFTIIRSARFGAARSEFLFDALLDLIK